MEDERTGSEEAPLPDLIERNVQALIRQRQTEDRQKSWHDRLAETVTKFTGSMTFVYLHLALFGSWIVVNLPGVPFPKFDPTYVVLAMFASVEAIFLSTFVLITQNRMAATAEKRAELDLQISLLSEHEVTKLITLVTAIASQMNLKEAEQPGLGELKEDVAPEKVMEQINDAEEKERGPDTTNRSDRM